MKPQKNFSVLEIITFILFLLYLFPFFIVLINSAKSAVDVTQAPMALPTDWSMIVKNMQTIWGSSNIR